MTHRHKLASPIHRLLTLTLLLSLSGALGAADPAPRTHLAALIASSRLKIVESSPVETAAGPGSKVVVSFDYIDPAGKSQSAKGKILLPPAILNGSARSAPLAYSAGYELPDAGAKAYLDRGIIAATPLATELNPMSRLPNLDTALLHALRAMPCVDDAKVFIFGGSAGGYTTLMLAAETFPLAAAVPSVPPINWGYNTRYFLANFDRVVGPDGKPIPKGVPTLGGVSAMLKPQCMTYYPHDTDDREWYLNSPISQLDTITAPVLAIFSTADVLVPIYQVSPKLVRPRDPAAFPAGFEPDPEKLTRASHSREALLDKLPPERYALTVVPADPSWPVIGTVNRKKIKSGEVAAPTWTVPFDEHKQWSIVVVDEGPMQPTAGHFYRVILPKTEDFVNAHLASPIAPEQLTSPKLQRLMARYSGQQAPQTSLHRLDSPEAERADVLRGLRTYVSISDAHAARFASLYAKLPPNRQSLGPAQRWAAPATVRGALESLR